MQVCGNSRTILGIEGYPGMEMENLDIGSICEMYGIDAEKLILELNGQMEKK